MIGQQRQILTDLGIDLWIPRDVACQNLEPHCIWRDQSIEQIIEIVPSSMQAEQPIVQQEIIAEPGVIQPQVDSPQKEPPVVVETPSVKPQLEQPMSLQRNFELQLLNLPHCTIVVDATQLSQDAKQLWANINQALQAEYQQLNWPFPLLNLQDIEGAQSYVEGFLDAHSVDKQLLSLGDLPCSHAKALKLASLEEMLAQPILKQRLWQFIQNNKQG